MFGKIFGACALGAAAGTAVALEMAPYLWWVGMLVGALVGYVSFEFRSVLRAAGAAWRTAFKIGFSIGCVGIVVFCLIAIAVCSLVMAAVRINAFVKFLWTLFKLVHSDIRVLCAFDAAIGTWIGWAAGSALIGALAGGTLGVLSYYLVSVRWLKLVPVKTKDRS